MTETSARQSIAHYGTVGHRIRINRTADAIELDRSDSVTVTRRRVLFEDVTGVTFHLRVDVMAVVVYALLTIAFTGAAIGIFLQHEKSYALALGAVAALALAATVLYAVKRASVITVFGRRSKAVIRMGLWRKRAEKEYARIIDDVKRMQDAMGERVPAADSNSPARSGPIA